MPVITESDGPEPTDWEAVMLGLIRGFFFVAALAASGIIYEELRSLGFGIAWAGFHAMFIALSFGCPVIVLNHLIKDVD